MIKNERQYRITKSQADRFVAALTNLRRKAETDQQIHPLLLQMEEDALKSQLADLENEIREYEAVRAGDYRVDDLRTVAELPKSLIRARIALGMSQKDLADRLGMKEQQIQRYEATEYASASLARIRVVVEALGVHIDDSVLPQNADVPLSEVVRRVSAVGLPQDFVLKRLLPRRSMLEDSSLKEYGQANALAHLAVGKIGRIFGWSPSQILGGEALQLEPARGGTRFKVATNAAPGLVSAYTFYAHYLSMLVAQMCSQIPVMKIPCDPFEFRESVITSYGSLSLDGIVRYLWDMGVPVLGLDDPAAFHGACFREQLRNVIVLKQRTSSESRWAFDLLHETWHAAQEPDEAERTVLEDDEMSGERRNSEEERTASRFAGVVLLAGRGHELAEECIRRANNYLPGLKDVVQRVAFRENVSTDALANYLAFRLAAEQGKDWWGAATNLQAMGNPWGVVRDVFFERASFSQLSDPDRDILAQALAPWVEVANG